MRSYSRSIDRSSKRSPTMLPIGSTKLPRAPTNRCKPKGSAPSNRMRYSIARCRLRAMLRKRPSRMKKSASPLSVMPSDRPMESFSPQGGRVHPDLEALLVLQNKDVAVVSCDARLKALDPELRLLHHALGRGDL